jgi:hypothetical protein
MKTYPGPRRLISSAQGPVSSSGCLGRGLQAIVDQQIDHADRIAVPIIEPIDSPAKRDAELLLRDALLAKLEEASEYPLMFKLTLPREPDLYLDQITENIAFLPNRPAIAAQAGTRASEGPRYNRRLCAWFISPAAVPQLFVDDLM